MFNLYYNAFNKELMNIILLGYMGVGKSLIGQHLSDKLNQKFIDLDKYIETEQSKSIHNIFTDSGDIYFRKIESQSLKDCLLNNSNIILSSVLHHSLFTFIIVIFDCDFFSNIFFCNTQGIFNTQFNR